MKNLTNKTINPCVSEERYYEALETYYLTYVTEPTDLAEIIEEERSMYSHTTYKELCEIVCSNVTWVVTICSGEYYHDNEDNETVILSEQHKEYTFTDLDEALVFYQTEGAKNYYYEQDGFINVRSVLLTIKD